MQWSVGVSRQRHTKVDAMKIRRNVQNTETLGCSFCRKSQDSVQKLIASPSDESDVRGEPEPNS